MKYDDNYPTCEDTSVTLRIFSDDMSPQVISSVLGIEPSFIQAEGEHINKDRAGSVINKTNGWFLSSDKNIISKDLRRHLHWLLEQISNKKEILNNLMAKGAIIDIFCPWESKSNQGGPIMAPEQMKLLGDLNIELQFEFWYSENEIST